MHDERILTTKDNCLVELSNISIVNVDTVLQAMILSLEAKTKNILKTTQYL